MSALYSAKICLLTNYKTTKDKDKHADMEGTMNFFRKIETEGISLRFVYKALLIIAVIASALILYATYHSSSTFYHLSNATDDFIKLQKAAYELMDASDYLTEKVQRFTVNGDIKFLNDYFTEAFETKRREEAIQIMEENPNSADALKELQQAMNESVELMDREYYSMKLVIEAKGYTDYPEILRDFDLTPEDAALDPERKMEKAQKMVLDDIYYDQKELIRQNMKDSLDSLERLTHGTQTQATDDMKTELKYVRILIVIQTIGIMIMIWLTARLGINPVLQAVDNIQEDSPIPVVGAIEFRYLAKTYNKMYEVYKNSIAHLNYKASHDELTNVYNRSGYELIVSTIDLSSTYLLLFDADNFKEINDTYGHDVGDKILRKITDSLRHNFRSDDYICRIGGDEFVVFMVHMDQNNRKQVGDKVRQINEELANTEDGLPRISLSAGIVYGKDAGNPDELLKKADMALYNSKHQGKNNYSFYDNLQ